MDDNPLLKTLIEAYGTEETKTALEEFFKDTLKLTSVFDITRLTEAQFKHHFNTAIQNENALKGHTPNPGALYDNVKCIAAQISHLYREHQTSDGSAQHQWHPPGIRAVEKQGPTYTNLFRENWDDACKIDSIAAIDSPVAYLRALYLFAKQLETSTSQSAGERTDRILLERRRPDLASLLIDQQNTFAAQPMLDIVNEILNKNIQAALQNTSDRGKSTYEILAQRRYPFTLPYEIFHHQCLLGLGEKKPVLGELNYLISTRLPTSQTVDKPYGQVLTSSTLEAQLLLSGLGPKQQALLTQAPFTTEGELTNSAYWKSIYGVDTPSTLNNVNTFLEHTGLKAEQLEELLSQGRHTPRRSPSYPTTTPHFAPYGARYVNGPFSAGTGMELDKNGTKKEIAGATDDRLERLHRMIRLQRWLDIPFADLDTLIVSTLESRVPRNMRMQLDTYTVRCLGVYRHLNRRYSIEAEEFGALLYQLVPYACGDNTPLFDRVFNRVRLFETPLVLDERAFSADDSDPVSHTILQHLSAGLGLPLTQDSLLLIVQNTERYVGELKCDLHTLSSIYRQARVARLFGLSIADNATLAQLLGGESVSRCLASGKTDIRTLRITAHRGAEKTEVVARFHLPEPFNPANPPLLLPGSTLKTNTSWFAAPGASNELLIRFASATDNLPSITISQISTAGAETEISLEGAPITLINGALDESGRGTPAMTSLIRYPSHTTTSQSTLYTETTVTQDEPVNLLDVLMQMDWLTQWINESVYTIPQLGRLLGPSSNDAHRFRDLQQHLDKLHRDVIDNAVTPQELAKLSLLPNINWRHALAETLLDDKGLVKNFAPDIEEDVPKKLDAALDRLINPQKMDADVSKNEQLKQDSKRKLKDLLLLAHDRQLHLVEKFLQETSQLPMNCTKGVLLWARTSVYQILTTALHDTHQVELPKTLHPVLRHAEATVQLSLGNRALRLFLKHPQWLETPSSRLELTLSSLYLLDRFNHCQSTHQHSEESLLNYLETAHSDAPKEVINNFLAQLLNWTSAEVTTLTAKLDHQTARTMKDVDWVMRSQTACKATGLSAASLLNAAALNNQSPADAWKKVGEAAMASSH